MCGFEAAGAASDAAGSAAKVGSAAATIAELRRQSSSYQERVVDFQEHTGSDVAMLRQELREFLIKVKRLIDEAAGRQP